MIPNIPGIESEGVVDALKFLQTYNLRGSVPVKKRIIVVGGGNAAIDAARTAIRLGAEQVHMFIAVHRKKCLPGLKKLMLQLKKVSF